MQRVAVCVLQRVAVCRSHFGVLQYAAGCSSVCVAVCCSPDSLDSDSADSHIYALRTYSAAVCCSALQRVAACVLQCVAAPTYLNKPPLIPMYSVAECCIVLQCDTVRVLQCVAVCRSVSQCAARCCRVLQHMCCSMLQLRLTRLRLC